MADADGGTRRLGRYRAVISSPRAARHLAPRDLTWPPPPSG
jgi:hypothetical protein